VTHNTGGKKLNGLTIAPTAGQNGKRCSYNWLNSKFRSALQITAYYNHGDNYITLVNSCYQEQINALSKTH